MIADDLELHPLVESGRSREPRVANGITGVVATGGVRQQEIMIGVQVMEYSFFLGPVQIYAPHCDRHHLGARRLDRVDHHGVGRILPGTNHQARTKLAARDGKWLRVGERLRDRRNQIGVRHDQPPPTK